MSTSSTSRCYSALCDIICVTVAISALSLCVVSFMGPGMEKSTATSGSGFHLLSCPKLFVDKEENKYSDIRLNRESTDKLMSMLEDSVQHAHVLHAGGEHSSVSRIHNSIFQAVEEQIGADKQVDINVPRRIDNSHLCDILKTIVDEQEKATATNDSNDEDGKHVTISIMKLETHEKESALLRGARMVRNSPLVDNVVMRLSSFDDHIRNALSETKKSSESTPKAPQPAVHFEGDLAEGDEVQLS